MVDETIHSTEATGLRERLAVGDQATIEARAGDGSPVETRRPPVGTRGANERGANERGAVDAAAVGHLHGSHTLESFVVGAGSRVAHAAVLAVAEHPGRTYNPLCVQGPPGVGKTHLLQGLARRLATTSRPSSAIGSHPQVHYTTGEAFTNRYIASTQSRELGAFLDELCGVDVLILDNLQFVVGKKRTQDALLEIATTLLSNDRQLVVSCDRKPSDLEEFSGRLLSLLRGGLEAPIESPSFDTRVAVVTAKARQKGFELPEVTAEFLAHHVTGSLRELEGALTCLINVAQLHGSGASVSVAEETTSGAPAGVSGRKTALTLSLARVALDDFLPSGGAAVPKAITAEAIIDAVVEFFKIPLKDVLSPVKVRTVVRARQVGMFLTRELTPLSLAQIGARFGGRDHTTVLYALRCVEHVHSRDPEFLAELDLLRADLRIR